MFFYRKIHNLNIFLHQHTVAITVCKINSNVSVKYPVKGTFKSLKLR